MRILHVTTAHQADDVRIFERECRSLAGVTDYTVALAAPGTMPAGFPVRQLTLPPTPATRRERFALSAWRAGRALRGLDADVYHFHDPELLPLALLYARRGRTVIWDAHEDYIGEMDVTGPKDWVPGPARGAVQHGTRALLRAVDRHAAGVVAATSDIASRYTNPRTVVVGNQARVADFAACRPQFDAGRLLYTGHAGDQHCFRELAEAVARIPGLSLVVAGRSRDADVWGHAESVLGDRLIHTGWVDRPGLRDLISSASLGIVAYADIRTNEANSPNKLFEFAAAGLPVAATPNPGIAAALRQSHGGVLAADFSSAGLETAIRTALRDPDRWLSMSDAARHWAGISGSWEASERVLLDLYAQLPVRRGVARPG